MERVGFDLDGVLYPWHELVYYHLTKEEIIKDVSFSDFWVNVDKFISSQLLYSFTVDPVFMSYAHPDIDDHKTIVSLAKNYEIFYITARVPEVAIATRNWIKYHKFPYPENVFVVQEKKLEEIKRNNIRYFVEDRAEYALELRDFCKVFLVKKPWNESIQHEFICINKVSDLQGLLPKVRIGGKHG